MVLPVPKQNLNPISSPAQVSNRILTRPEFQRLAEVPPEVEWFANIKNENTRKAYRADLSAFMKFTGITQPEEFRLITVTPDGRSLSLSHLVERRAQRAVGRIRERNPGAIRACNSDGSDLSPGAEVVRAKDAERTSASVPLKAVTGVLVPTHGSNHWMERDLERGAALGQFLEIYAPDSGWHRDAREQVKLCIQALEDRQALKNGQSGQAVVGEVKVREARADAHRERCELVGSL